jgi:hypothetical protein
VRLADTCSGPLSDTAAPGITHGWNPLGSPDRTSSVEYDFRPWVGSTSSGCSGYRARAVSVESHCVLYGRAGVDSNIGSANLQCNHYRAHRLQHPGGEKVHPETG